MHTPSLAPPQAAWPVRHAICRAQTPVAPFGAIAAQTRGRARGRGTSHLPHGRGRRRNCFQIEL